ncbi:MAG: phytanoyl-CoA dioxygenase family protein [Gammaproteobacteria bacterium]|nr:phytanoyl-CoA dioxygenase family protein [Gammaproteobacteria bacterium]
MTALTSDEIRAYENDGYVVPAYRVPEARMAVLSAALKEVIAANADTRPEQLPNIHITNGAGTHLKGHPAFLDIALDEDLLDLVSCVIGDDIVLWGCQIFCKPGSDGVEVPMHQDGQYWPIRPLATCTVWLAVDDSDRENGCLKVIPGSHRGRVHFRHRTRTDDDIVLNQAVDDRRAFARPPACIELERGQLSMHDIYLVHGSAPNTSGRRRAGVAIRYMPTTSWFRRDLEMQFSGYPSNFKDRPIWLARGRDVCGRNDFTIGHAAGEPVRAAVPA